MNGIFWRIKFVDSMSPFLIDRTGDIKLATTDPKTHRVYLSDELHGNMANKVLAHELGHCVIFSYGLLDYIHEIVHPEYWFEAEEWICNFVADYGWKIFSISHHVLGDEAWSFIPYDINKDVA